MMTTEERRSAVDGLEWVQMQIDSMQYDLCVSGHMSRDDARDLRDLHRQRRSLQRRQTMQTQTIGTLAAQFIARHKAATAGTGSYWQQRNNFRAMQKIARELRRCGEEFGKGQALTHCIALAEQMEDLAIA